MMRQLLLVVILLCQTLAAHAHKPSDSYLNFAVEANVVTGQWDIALRDLDFAIGLDLDGDAAITWGEVRSKISEIDSYAIARLSLQSASTNCPITVTDHLIDDHTDGAYVVLRFKATCADVITSLQARYGLFFDVDPLHKGLLQLQYQGESTSAIFSPDRALQQFSLTKPSRIGQFFDYAREGVWHIWIGFDHILFLLALLLPAVVVRQRGRWEAVQAFKPAFFSVLKIVTAFTLAHSITLTLATLGIISLPSRWVESTIAASVVIAALNNVRPFFKERRWMMAFLFGLIHGFGFASVLTDLGLPKTALVLALVGFNVGVETGQLAIVAVFLPLAFYLRHTLFYRRAVLIGGSVVIAILAAGWFAERAFDMKFLPF